MSSTLFSSTNSINQQDSKDSELLDVETFIQTTVPIRDRDPKVTKLLDGLIYLYEVNRDSDEGLTTISPVITEVFSVKSEKEPVPSTSKD